MKLLKLTLIMILSITMLTGCGGGSSSGGSEGIVHDPTLAEKYPLLSQSYQDLEKAFLDNSLAPEQRTASIMKCIDDPFYDRDGYEKRAHFESTTLDRFKRYTTKLYSLSTGNFIADDDGKTVKVRTVITFHFEVIPGKEGTNYGKQVLGPTDAQAIWFTWRLVGDDWKISQGIPYRKDEMD